MRSRPDHAGELATLPRLPSRTDPDPTPLRAFRASILAPLVPRFRGGGIPPIFSFRTAPGRNFKTGFLGRSNFGVDLLFMVFAFYRATWNADAVLR